MNSQDMYCVKCKRQTPSTNVEFSTTSNNRRMMKGICGVCGSKKTLFVKSTMGGSIEKGKMPNLRNMALNPLEYARMKSIPNAIY